jgi:phage-related protein
VTQVHTILEHADGHEPQQHDRAKGAASGIPWLKQDLAAHANACTLAYWHEPRFSSGQHGNAQQMATIWNDLVAAHADVVLSGHNHDYERFEPIGATPQDTAASPNFQQPKLDPNGIREFVVGTGGASHYAFGPPVPGSQVRVANRSGVLRMRLSATSYNWSFVDVSGKVRDSGTTACHR